MKLFIVEFGGRIAGSHDHVYVMANDEHEAFKIGKPKLNTHKLVPDFLNQYGRFSVREVENPPSILPFLKVYHR